MFSVLDLVKKISLDPSLIIALSCHNITNACVEYCSICLFCQSCYKNLSKLTPGIFHKRLSWTFNIDARMEALVAIALRGYFGAQVKDEATRDCAVGQAEHPGTPALRLKVWKESESASVHTVYCFHYHNQFWMRPVGESSRQICFFL